MSQGFRAAVSPSPLEFQRLDLADLGADEPAPSRVSILVFQAWIGLSIDFRNSAGVTRKRALKAS